MFFKKKKYIFNLHLVLGFMICIPLVLVALSGSLISYDKQIATLINKIILKDTKSEILNPDFENLLSNFRDKNPNLEIISVKFDEKNQKFYTIRVLKEQESLTLFVSDEGEILGQDYGTKFNRFVRQLHRWLLFSEFDLQKLGKNIVALTTIGFMILVISGFYIYFPHLKYNAIKAFSINFHAKKQMIFYKFHAVFGVIFGLIFLFICLSGLYWSYEWINNLVNRAFGVPNSGIKMAHKREINIIENSFVKDDFTIVLSKFKDHFKDYNQSLSITQTKEGIYTFAYEDGGIKKLAQITTDGGFKEVNSAMQISERKKVSMTILALHSGRFFGNIGEFIFCVVSFFGALIALSGIFMTYFRLKPKFRHKN
ncbi:putative bifunctional protein: sulfite reductase [NADPH] flavoprotein alpha-component%3B iron-uptake factor [Campylobacter hyointestinalis subsp. hyointestinalis]|uniref:Bifunctional protein: sulfite reductase [NADPH] flavoprotein alpha-component; iron-uptake factor n=1 Tax=Campylobacter hyointestinalis subsp. hyointestinalis TaxID=91352 RepID=A0A0S4RWB2_CAMHY|nr:PepSY-associated TM helix domain-containing protein [Campylobacter hyointestinalis]CUU78223.1 putative bifunctional protein: sulfite reductase [NADPH] flavoprotein alpha-component%3B iron-uptake factor [Campylobacter hyointestinalis subsp. hyointestinalis]